MRRLFATNTEVVLGGDQASTEMSSPNPVDHHTWHQRIRISSQPASQFKPTTFGRPGQFFSSENLEVSPHGRLPQLRPVTPDLNPGVHRLVLVNHSIVQPNRFPQCQGLSLPFESLQPSCHCRQCDLATVEFQHQRFQVVCVGPADATIDLCTEERPDLARFATSRMWVRHLKPIDHIRNQPPAAEGLAVLALLADLQFDLCQVTSVVDLRNQDQLQVIAGFDGNRLQGLSGDRRGSGPRVSS